MQRLDQSITLNLSMMDWHMSQLPSHHADRVARLALPTTMSLKLQPWTRKHPVKYVHVSNSIHNSINIFIILRLYFYRQGHHHCGHHEMHPLQQLPPPLGPHRCHSSHRC